MKAVVLAAAGRVAVVEDWPEPGCGPDEVVVGMRGVGLCGSDLAVVHGERPVPRLPWVLGHEGFGTVLAVGDRVGDRRVGQRVAIEPNYPCLTCSSCAEGVTAGCGRRRALGITEPGVLAERVAVPARFAWPVPDGLPDDDVVCVEPLAVALSAIRRGGVAPGQHCLVVGAGSQGLLVSMALARFGAVPVVTDPHAGRVALAERVGARAATPDDLARRYPVVVETSGVPEAFASALDRCVPGAVCLVIGQNTRPSRVSTATLVQHRLTVTGCLIYDHPGGFADTIAELQRLRPSRVVAARFGMSDAAHAFAEAPRVAGKSWISFAQPERSAPAPTDTRSQPPTS